MLKTKTIKTDKATVLVVEFPEGITEVTNTGKRLSIPDRKGGHRFFEGNWKLIGRIPDITEEQAVKTVDESIHSGLYAHYVKEVNPPNVYRYRSSRDSLCSLLQSNEVYFENKYDNKYFLGSEEMLYHANELKRNKAKSKIWDKERCYIFIKED